MEGDTIHRNGRLATGRSFHELWLNLFPIYHPKCTTSFLISQPSFHSQRRVSPLPLIEVIPSCIKWFCASSIPPPCLPSQEEELVHMRSQQSAPTGVKPCAGNQVDTIQREMSAIKAKLNTAPPIALSPLGYQWAEAAAQRGQCREEPVSGTIHKPGFAEGKDMPYMLWAPISFNLPIFSSCPS